MFTYGFKGPCTFPALTWLRMVQKNTPIFWQLFIKKSLSEPWNQFKKGPECFKISILRRGCRQTHGSASVDLKTSRTLPAACITAWVNAGANGVNQEIIATGRDSGGNVRGGNGIDKKWKFRLGVNTAICEHLLGTKDQRRRERESERRLTGSPFEAGCNEDGEQGRRHPWPLTSRKWDPVDSLALDRPSIRMQDAARRKTSLHQC